jgi:hypothetical protein
MAKKTATSSTIPGTIPTEPHGLASYGVNMADWPDSWMGFEKDILPGQQLVGCFQLFCERLLTTSLTRKTVHKHINNLWLLGGEVIRDLNEDGKLRKIPIGQLLLQILDEDGGPLIHNGSEEEQRSFDSTCRKLYRFLADRPR